LCLKKKRSYLELKLDIAGTSSDIVFEKFWPLVPDRYTKPAQVLKGTDREPRSRFSARRVSPQLRARKTE
jgi:hypothetical protein